MAEGISAPGPSQTQELDELVRSKITNLRPKLLDLGRRNPLIAARLTPRSSSIIRIVDELPDLVFYKIGTSERLRIIPLPAIETDPPDERTRQFTDRLANARLTDEDYLEAIDTLDPDEDAYLDQTQRIERALKDRVRESLGLPERQSGEEINLTHHARVHGIVPAYDLPDPEEVPNERKHQDNDIQTLFLPEDLERKLNSISSKCRTWQQETGLNVLHVAFGFLEWADTKESTHSFAPLVLTEVNLTKVKTPKGAEFFIEGTGAEPETNTVLLEKLRIEFDVALPAFEGGSVEDYLSAVDDLSPKSLPFWRLRRQIAIGVFPSARMAMYHDLDPTKLRLGGNDIVRALLAGGGSGEASPFADEYEVDQPNIEKHVPSLIFDADSSQFSALVDVAQGKNLALEGPPGTGKSQTIVNAVAAAIGTGKKVLFVAEKLAALNVVKSRLESAGLGEFLLPLQADRSAREQVIDSIRDRLALESEQSPREYAPKLRDFRRSRNDLSDYLALMSAPFRESGLTVREILGRTIAANPRLDRIPKDIITKCEISAEVLSGDGIEHVRRLAGRIAEAHQQTLAAHPAWRTTGLANPDRFTVEEVCDLAAEAASKFGSLAERRDLLPEVQLPPDVPLDLLKKILALLTDVPAGPSLQILETMLDGATRALVADLLECCKTFQNAKLSLSPLFVSDISSEYLERLRRIAEVCDRIALSSIHHEDIADEIAKKSKLLELARGLVKQLTPLVEQHPECRHWKLSDIAQAYALVKSCGRAALSLRKGRLAECDPESIILTCEGLRKLRTQKRELGEALTASVVMSPPILAEHAAVLRESGTFAFLFPSYRKARRLYQSISGSRKFQRNEAAGILSKLAGFLKGQADFEANPLAKLIFGGRYRGVDTEFEPFDSLARYYIALEDVGSTPVRQFLREASLADLERLPEIPPAAATDLTFDLLDAKIEEIETQIAALQEAAATLKPYMDIFVDARSINPARIPDIVEHLARALDHAARVNDHDAAALLGDLFAGPRTELGVLSKLIQWSAEASFLAEHVRPVLVNGCLDEARENAAIIIDVEERADSILSDLMEKAKVEQKYLRDQSSFRNTAKILTAASTDVEGLFACASSALIAQPLDELGFEPLRDYLAEHKGSLDELADGCESLVLRSLARAVVLDHGSRLGTYTGAHLNELRRSIASLDRDLIVLARKDLRARIIAGAKPPVGNSAGKKSTYTEMALIENEVNKTQRFIPVRDLTQRAGRALQELKPCWMMSPLAVAQYVPRNALKFDLCIIDEASQMPPESALGALLRSSQAVVVGDTNQLPPSNFFRTVIDDEDSDEDETVLNESVLEMANATFRPSRRLRWHYRSRHSGLIRFSNQLIYDDDLIVFPSVNESSKRMGVELRNVDGVYKAGTNPIEAAALVEATLAFMREDRSRSLGIVTLNQKQRELVREEFEARAATDTKIQDYLEHWRSENDGLEEFFIKNLENVQGDERDVIFIGTVYGPEEAGGRVMQRFGPINGLAGRRRLNVLFTRAKQKICTFSSMTAADIIAEENGNAGAYMLKRWLGYSKTGVLEAGKKTSRGPDSDFEVFVMNQISGMGCEPIPQVGVAGYFIDIGVRHPQWPHGFMLGVECDGANYHSAKSARDRDRLRQQVLEGLGWHLHRIWSTDWFNNPGREAERLRKAITDRLAKLKDREGDFEAPVIKVQSKPQPQQLQPGLFTSRSSRRDNRTPQSSLFKEESGRPIVTKSAGEVTSIRPITTAVSVGDTVRVKYLADGGKELSVKISREKNDPGAGIVYHESPLAKALLGAEEGDEVTVLIGNQVRAARIEKISKGVVMTH